MQSHRIALKLLAAARILSTFDRDMETIDWDGTGGDGDEPADSLLVDDKNDRLHTPTTNRVDIPDSMRTNLETLDITRKIATIVDITRHIP